jgi:dihydroorotate dehydrogenase
MVDWLNRLAHKSLLRLPPESAHEIGIAAMQLRIGAPGRFISTEHSGTQTELFGVKIDNPLGLAAGFDKNGLLADTAPDYGFGWIEIGSVTYCGGPGNSKPRLFRLREKRSLLNRMGLNGEPAASVAEKLAELTAQNPTAPFAVNIAKTRDHKIIGDAATQDILDSYNRLFRFGIYTAINISCPNTEEGKTFEDNPHSLKELLSETRKIGRTRPVLVKLSPNRTLTELEKILEAAEPFVDGYVCGNTLPSAQMPEIFQRYGKGGISGELLRIHTLKLIENVRKLTRKPIIACGGISSGEHMLAAYLAGANYFQAYTGFIYHGLRFAHDANTDFIRLLNKSREN